MAVDTYPPYISGLKADTFVEYVSTVSGDLDTTATEATGGARRRCLAARAVNSRLNLDNIL